MWLIKVRSGKWSPRYDAIMGKLNTKNVGVKSKDKKVYSYKPFKSKKGTDMWLIEVLYDLEKGLLGFIGSWENCIPTKNESHKSIKN